MVDLYLHYINFLNFAKSCFLSCLSQFDNTEKKLVSSSSFFSYKRVMLTLRVFLAGNIVAMVICHIKWITVTCFPVIGHLCDTIIVALLVKQW